VEKRVIWQMFFYSLLIKNELSVYVD